MSFLPPLNWMLWRKQEFSCTA